MLIQKLPRFNIYAYDLMQIKKVNTNLYNFELVSTCLIIYFVNWMSTVRFLGVLHLTVIKVHKKIKLVTHPKLLCATRASKPISITILDRLYAKFYLNFLVCCYASLLTFV